MVCTHVRVELAWVTEFLAVATSDAADKHGEQTNVLDAVEPALPLLRWSIGGWFRPWAKSKSVLRSSPMKGWGEPSNHRSITPAAGNNQVASQARPSRVDSNYRYSAGPAKVHVSRDYTCNIPDTCTIQHALQRPSRFLISCEFLPPLLRETPETLT